MLIYDVLKKDHDKLKPLLAQLVKSHSADEETRTKLLEQIRDELIPHSRAEEAVFYNSLRTIDGTQHIATEGYEEHLEAETILRALQTMNAINVEWQKTAQKLKDSIEHHIQEEEDEYFREARQVLTDEEARLMADAFNQMKPELKENGFMQNTLELIANIMPQRFSGPLRKFTHHP